MASRDLTIGKYGHEILGLLYRYGALTRPQIKRLTKLNESAMDRQLRHLREGGLVARARDVASWREDEGAARTGYYLTLPRGVQVAAHSLGLENDYLILKGYRRIRLPGTVAHRLMGNEYLIRLLEAAEAAGIEVGEIFCESWPDAPMFGTGSPKTDRAGSPYRYRRIVPDGAFTLADSRYVLEVETGTNTRRELVAKFGDYGGRWRRQLRPNVGEKKHHDPHARLEPVVLLTLGDEHAKRLQKYLRERLPKEDDWAQATKVIGDVSGGRADPLMLVLVAGVDEVRGDPLARVYRPLRKYPETLSSGDGWRVGLKDAAEISSRIPVPVEPPEETLEEEELAS